jgi:rhodanese-related sulfurtransferase
MSPNLVALAAFIAIAGLYYWFTMAGKTPSSEARRLVADGAKLVDVRTPVEFSAGHVPGALNLPLGDLESRLGELGDRKAPLVLYCRSGARSGQAKRLLESKGFQRVHDVGAMSRYGE